MFIICKSEQLLKLFTFTNYKHVIRQHESCTESYVELVGQIGQLIC